MPPRRESTGPNSRSQPSVKAGASNEKPIRAKAALTKPPTGTPACTVQAAIAAVHAQAPSAEETDWREVAGLYDVLLELDRSPVVELNRAVAVAMRDGPAAGLVLVDALLERGELRDYHLAHAARADLCRRLGRTDQARESYRAALVRTRQPSERRFLERRLAELE